MCLFLFFWIVKCFVIPKGFTMTLLSPFFAAMKCPKNSFYEICSTSCPANCKDLAPPQGCKEQCEEGCTCEEGFIQSGKACVPFEQCGCIHNDLYYNFGELFFPSGDCKEKCKCNRGGEVKLYFCVHFLCSSCQFTSGVHDLLEYGNQQGSIGRKSRELEA